MTQFPRCPDYNQSMPLTITRLRKWFALSAILLVLVVAGFYFYARLRVQRALEDVPRVQQEAGPEDATELLDHGAAAGDAALAGQRAVPGRKGLDAAVGVVGVQQGDAAIGLRPLPPEGQGNEARGPEGGKEAATVHGSSYHRILRSWSARAISGVKA